MSSIEKFYTTTFTLKRQVWSGDSSALEQQSTFSGLIEQKMSSVLEQNSGFRFTKSYTVFCSTDVDVQEGDRLEASGRVYDVKYIVEGNLGDNAHYEVICERNDLN